MVDGDADCPYVSRAGLKLAAGLDAFERDVRGKVCADLGCNVGGFTDCLLRRGAARVYAVDTGYGALAWTLRKDDRVIVMERTNALHADAPEPVDLVVIDVAWTPQRLILPAAGRWLKCGGQVLSLLKPQYEAAADRRKGVRKSDHVLDAAAAHGQCLKTCGELAAMDWTIRAVVRSPIVGAAGNVEFMIWATPG